MKWLGSIFAKGADFISWNIRSLWNVLLAIIKQKWAVFLAIIGAIYTFVGDAITWVTQAVETMVQMTVATFDLSAGTDVMAMLPIANTFAPLSEFFVLIIAYTALLAALFLYRFIKSLVPTWGNT
jgi:hypothetical protein